MFIQRLENLMETKNIKNYVVLSKKIDIPSSTMYNWKKSLPSGENLITLADFFDVSIDYLMGRTNEASLVRTEHHLTAAEDNLLSIFRRLPTKEQYRAIGVIQALSM